MAFTTIATCPACRASYVVSCRTEGAPQLADEREDHSFLCNDCGASLNTRLPKNAQGHTVKVRRD